MTGFILLSLALLAAVLWRIAPALLRQSADVSADHTTDNIQIARERLADLAGQLQSGEIDQDLHDRTVAEIELTLVNEADQASLPQQNKNVSKRYQRAMLVMLSAIPFVSFGLYQYWGNPDAISGQPVSTASTQGTAPQGEHAMSIEMMLQKLEDKLAANPNNPNGWYMLGRSYMVRKDYPRAAKAYQKLYELVGDQPEVLLGLADALTMTHNGDMSGQPFELVKKALGLEPENRTALWLAGMGYQQAGDIQHALTLWQRLLPMLSEDPQSSQEVRSLIAQAQRQLGITPTDDMTASNTAATATTPAATAELTVQVTLDPKLKNTLNPNSYVMVYAQRVQGLKMPLAMVRLQVKDLPQTVTLSDAQALSPMNRLSMEQQVNVIARISESGQAIKQPGDVEVKAGPFATDTQKTVSLQLK